MICVGSDGPLGPWSLTTRTLAVGHAPPTSARQPAGSSAVSRADHGTDRQEPVGGWADVGVVGGTDDEHSSADALDEAVRRRLSAVVIDAVGAVRASSTCHRDRQRLSPSASAPLRRPSSAAASNTPLATWASTKSAATTGSVMHLGRDRTVGRREHRHAVTLDLCLHAGRERPPGELRVVAAEDPKAFSLGAVVAGSVVAASVVAARSSRPRSWWSTSLSSVPRVVVVAAVVVVAGAASSPAVVAGCVVAGCVVGGRSSPAGASAVPLSPARSSPAASSPAAVVGGSGRRRGRRRLPARSSPSTATAPSSATAMWAAASSTAGRRRGADVVVLSPLTPAGCRRCCRRRHR